MKNGKTKSKNEEYILKKDKNGKKVTVRDLQLSILDIMDEIHRVCVKHDIPYALIAGSALGICNYKGFIPWDDDMDVCIERKDFDRFVDALNKDLSDKFYFQCFENDKRYNILIPSMKVRKKDTYIEEVNFLLKNRCKSGDGIFVDVVIYDSISESKFKDELYRTVSKVLMPFIVLLDNLRINPILLKKIVLKNAEHYNKINQNSKYTSQTIAIPWEKFLKEPIFLKEDVYPFKLYEFEGRKYYSYNNVEKVVKEWYGPNCLKKWNGKEYVETLPVEKRKPKHCVDINLKSDEHPKQKSIKNGFAVAFLLFLLSLILFNDTSLVLMGLGISIIGATLLFYINKD